MKTKPRLKSLQISALLKAGKTFEVLNHAERQRVLTAGKFLDVEVTTKSNGNGGFTVQFIKP